MNTMLSFNKQPKYQVEKVIYVDEVDAIVAVLPKCSIMVRFNLKMLEASNDYWHDWDTMREKECHHVSARGFDAWYYDTLLD